MPWLHRTLLAAVEMGNTTFVLPAGYAPPRSFVREIKDAAAPAFARTGGIASRLAERTEVDGVQQGFHRERLRKDCHRAEFGCQVLPVFDVLRAHEDGPTADALRELATQPSIGKARQVQIHHQTRRAIGQPASDNCFDRVKCLDFAPCHAQPSRKGPQQGVIVVDEQYSHFALIPTQTQSMRGNGYR